MAKALQHKLSTFEQLNLTESAKNFGFRNFNIPESYTNQGCKFINYLQVMGLEDVSVLTEKEVYTRMFSAFEKLKKELAQLTAIN